MNSLEQDINLDISTSNSEITLNDLTNVGSIVVTNNLEQDVSLDANFSTNELKINDLDNVSLNPNVSTNELKINDLDNVSNINTSLYNYIEGTGSNDYNVLSNKPKINDIILQGNKTSSQLGLQDTIVDITNSEINNLF